MEKYAETGRLATSATGAEHKLDITFSVEGDVYGSKEPMLIAQSPKKKKTDTDSDSGENRSDDVLDISKHTSDSNSDVEYSVRSNTEFSEDLERGPSDKDYQRSANNRAKRLVKALSAVSLIDLYIHLPQDHFQVVEMKVSSDWTLAEVFNQIQSKISMSKRHRNSANYIFLTWESGQHGDRRLLHSPAAESGTLFSRNIKSTVRQSTAEIEDARAQFDGVTEKNVKKTSYFGFTSSAPVSTDLKQSSSASNQAVGSTQEAPQSMQFNMIAECSLTILPMDTKISTLRCFRLRLCHQAEWNIYRQACSNKTNVIQQEGILNIFSRSKVKYICPFMRFDGNVPFNPHKFLGFYPSLSLRVPDETDWSNALNLLGADFGSGGDYVTVYNQASDGSDRNTSSSKLDLHYEFGIYAEKGKGIYQNITSISIVPKHIIVSKLPSLFFLRQASINDSSTYLKMVPDTVQSYHFHHRWDQKLLQVSRVADNASAPDAQDKWFGEIDISSLGIIYAKLRDPLSIIKIQIEMVGASLVSTFSSQNDLWPPYRIDNKTTVEVRFRQNIPPTSLKILSQNKSRRNTTSSRRQTISSDADNQGSKSLQYIPSTLDAIQESVPVDVDLIPWDYLSPFENVPYTWDYPKSEKRVLRLEFKQVYNQSDNWSNFVWVGEDISLDNFSGAKTLTLKRNIGSMSKTSAESYLYVKNSSTWSLGGNEWVKLFCVLQDDNIFLFKDDSQMELVDIVNLAKRVQKSQVLQLAHVERYEPKKKEKNEYALTFFTTSTSQNKKMDVNRIRILELRLAESLGLFGVFAKDSNAEELGASKFQLHTQFSRSGAATQLDVNSTLRAHLQAKIFVEQLLEKISRLTFTLPSIIDTLIGLGECDDKYQAIELVSQLYSDNIIQCVDEDLDDFTIDASDILEVNSGGSDIVDHNDDADSEEECERHFGSDMGTKTVGNVSSVATNSSPNKSPNKSPSKSPVKNVSNAEKTNVDADGVVPRQKRSIRPSFGDIVSASGLGALITKENVDLGPLHVKESTLSALKTSITAYNISSLLPISFSHSQSNSQNHSQVFSDAASEKSFAGSGIQAPPKISDIPELRFTFVPLQPELLETIERVDENPMGPMHDEFSHQAENESYGFTIGQQDKEFHFLCGNQLEYMHWIDGPTVVLELKEDNIVNEGDIQKSVPTSNPQTASTVSSTMTAEITGADQPSNSVVSIRSSNDSGGINQSTGLTPVLKVAVTVQEFQTCNQLLNPSYPVLVHPRLTNQSKSDDHSPSQIGSPRANKLMLPGLIQKEGSFPCLHLYIQQKLYHPPPSKNSNKGEKAVNMTTITGNDGTSVNLFYFEMVSVWLAPMEVNLDDEIITRLLRYVQVIRNSLKQPDIDSPNNVKEEILALQYQGSKSWGTLDPKVVSDNYFNFQESCRSLYVEFSPLGKAKNFLYFSLLQLHPLDFVLKFRSLTGFSMTNTEGAFVSLINQLDSSRLCLNALIVEHAFGSTTIILDTVIKHYKASLWKQFHKLIGTADLMEGSVGLVSNLGTGVHDMFYEPIDGLVDENNSFLDGLSKGGKSLASHAIGGTSAFTSKLTGGIGNGVSLLTMDAEFYRNRANRRLKKAKSVSQGIYVGTKELGKNIVEGVSGIVVSPYRGWEENGATGLGIGLAKGILGVAFKPAVGVFDLASRTSEGIRNSAFGGGDDRNDANIMRVRIPRHFGSNNVIVPYNLHSAAAQYL
ncbi:unnamed protein product, partial [Sphagnum jensenii]